MKTVLNEKKKITIASIDLDKANKIMSSKSVLEKCIRLSKRGFHTLKSEEELNQIQKKVVENKIKEIEESYNTTSVSGEVEHGKNTEVGVEVGKSKTKKELRNIVLMAINNMLSIVEANDKGKIISITTIFIKNSGTMKFVKFQTSLFKF